MEAGALNVSTVTNTEMNVTIKRHKTYFINAKHEHARAPQVN
jgi:hypothetical protein